MKKIAIVSVIAIAAFMIAATTLIAGHDAQARLVIINKRQFKDNSQNIKFPENTNGQTVTHNPTNVQTQHVDPNDGS